MREIKFRAWDGKEMFPCWPCTPDGDVVIKGFVDTFLSVYLPAGHQGMHIYDKVEAIMQYTGIKDNNWKEIYEGDIINVDNSDPEENGEYDVTTVCKWDNGCFILEDQAGGHWTRQLFHKPHRLTVVGNIYQTPHLLSSEAEAQVSDTTKLLNEQKAGTKGTGI